MNKWEQAKYCLWGGGITQPVQGGAEILPIASCYRNRDKLLLFGPVVCVGLCSVYPDWVGICIRVCASICVKKKLQGLEETLLETNSESRNVFDEELCGRIIVTFQDVHEIVKGFQIKGRQRE